jgi:hypothetical protein
MQNLQNDAPVKKQKSAPVFACSWCNKKYKTHDKYEKHVKQMHPFAAKFKNMFTLTHDEKMWLLDAVQTYTYILLAGTPSEFNLASEKIGARDEVHALFRQRITANNLLQKLDKNGEQMLLILADFEAFLNLGIPWNDGNFCPSLLIDLVWHSAMVHDYKKYEMLCKRFLSGRVLTHCVAPPELDEVRFKEFEKQFQHQHKRKYMSIGDIHEAPPDALDARSILLGIEENRRIQRQADEERWAEASRRMRLQIEEEKRNGTWKPYQDDGKC